VEWYSENGRVVLELDPSQLEIVDVVPPEAKTPAELLEDEKQRSKAFASFLGNMLAEFSEENRKKGGDGNVTGIVVG
jgi:hypothetical protein